MTWCRVLLSNTLSREVALIYIVFVQFSDAYFQRNFADGQ